MKENNYADTKNLRDLENQLERQCLNFFHAKFDKIHKKYADENLGKSEANKRNKEKIKLALGQWAKIIREHYKDYLNEDQAWELLRRAHIRYYEEEENKGFKDNKIESQFNIIVTNDQKPNYKKTCNVTSKQAFLGKFRNGYDRWRQGLPAFRSHEIRVLDETSGKEQILKYYGHSSPVPYEIPDFKERIEATQENFREFFSEVDPKGSLTEIRLLSPVKSLFPEDYQQILETYFAAILTSTSENPITLFVYGVNMARVLTDNPLTSKEGLQSCINTRAKNELFEKAFALLDIETAPEVGEQQQKLLEEIRQKRTDLQEKIKKLYDSHQNEKDTQEKFLELLKAQHSEEKNLLKSYKKIWDQQKSNPKKIDKTNPHELQKALIYEDLKTLFILFEKNAHSKGDLNGEIQAALVRLNCRLGEKVASGCNDAKDRYGLVAIKIEANEIFKQMYEHYPHYQGYSEEDKRVQEQLEKKVAQVSTPALAAEAVSMPGLAKKLDKNSVRQFLSHVGPSNQDSEGGIFKEFYRTCYKKHANKRVLGLDRLDQSKLEKLSHIKFEPSASKPEQKKILKENFKSQQNKQAPKELVIEKNTLSKNPKNSENADETKNPPLKILILENGKCKAYEGDALNQYIENEKLSKSSNTKIDHKIEVFENKIRCLAPSDASEQELIRDIQKALQQAFENFNPKPSRFEDLSFKGNLKMQSLARNQAAAMFRDLVNQDNQDLTINVNHISPSPGRR